MRRCCRIHRGMHVAPRRGYIMHSLRPYKQPTVCDNMNHRRPNAPVGHCPQCGEVVNPSAAASSCGDDKHAAARRRQVAYCVDCGERIIATFLR